MERRSFIGTLAGGLLAAPLAAAAQQPQGSYRVGFLCDYPYSPVRAFSRVFLPTLRDLGYVEGRNLRVEVRSATSTRSCCPPLRLSWCASTST